jgi:O-antigen/teichoic acid export membrane protein
VKQRLLTALRGKFVRDTLILQLGSVVRSGTYLVTSVLTARMLGPMELGRWATSRQMYMLAFFLVNMGLTNAAVSRYSQAKGSGDHQAAVDALAALIKVGLLMTSLIMLLGYTVAPGAAEYFYEGDREVGVLAAILCFSTIGEVLRSLALAALNGTRQMKHYAIFDAYTNLLRVGLVGAALAVEASPRAVAWAFLAHGLLSGVMALRAYGRARHLSPSVAPPPLREVLAAIPQVPLRSFFGLSLLLALSKSLNSVVPRLGMLLIPALAVVANDGFTANGGYHVGMMLNLVLTGAIGAIATNVLPTLGIMIGQSDVPVKKLGPTFRRLSLTAGFLSVGATVVSIPVVWLVLKYAYGSDYESSIDYYMLLALGNLFMGFGVIVEPFFIYATRMRHLVIFSLAAGVVATAGIYSAAQAWGPKGAAAAGGLTPALVVFPLVYIWVYFRRVHAEKAPTP